ASGARAFLLAPQVEIVGYAGNQLALKVEDAAVGSSIRATPPRAQNSRRFRIDLTIGRDHDAIDFKRRGYRNRTAVKHVFTYLFRCALEGVAEASRRRPDDCVDIGGLLLEVFL